LAKLVGYFAAPLVFSAGNLCYDTGISTPPNYQVYVISRRLYLGWLRLGSGHVMLRENSSSG
jgi:hypothetical protein